MNHLTATFEIHDDESFKRIRKEIFDNFTATSVTWNAVSISHNNESHRMSLIQQVMESGVERDFKLELIEEILSLTGEGLMGYDIDSILEEYLYGC